MLINKFQDPEIMQEIEHEIDIELENINDMIAVEKQSKQRKWDMLEPKRTRFSRNIICK